MAKKLAKKSAGGRIERLEDRAQRVMGRAQKNWSKAQEALKYDETAKPETSNAVGYANRKLNRAAAQEDRAKNIMAKANELKKKGGATKYQKGGGVIALPIGTKSRMVPASNMKKGGANPGFKAVQAKIAKKQGVSKEAAGAILAASTRKASAKAKAKNPRLKRVKG